MSMSYTLILFSTHNVVVSCWFVCQFVLLKTLRLTNIHVGNIYYVSTWDITEWFGTNKCPCLLFAILSIFVNCPFYTDRFN